MDANRIFIVFVGVMVGAVIAAVCPWGEIPMNAGLSGIPEAGGAFPIPFAGTLTVDAFNGHINFLGIKTPNWLVALSTLLGAGLAMLKLKDLEVPTGLILLPFAVSSVFLLVAFVALSGSGGATVGIGIPLLLAVNVVGFVACFRISAAATEGARRRRY